MADDQLLARFDRQLCEHIRLETARCRQSNPAFAEVLTDERYRDPLVSPEPYEPLREDEIHVIAGIAITCVVDAVWVPRYPLYDDWVDLLPVFKQRLGEQRGEEWADFSIMARNMLTGQEWDFFSGLSIVYHWLKTLRLLARAVGCPTITPRPWAPIV